MDLLFDQQLVLENYIQDVVAQGKAEGRAEDIAEGRAEGEVIGEEKKTIAIAEKMLLLGVNTLEQIEEVTGLSKDKLQKLKCKLKLTE